MTRVIQTLIAAVLGAALLAAPAMAQNPGGGGGGQKARAGGGGGQKAVRSGGGGAQRAIRSGGASRPKAVAAPRGQRAVNRAIRSNTTVKVRVPKASRSVTVEQRRVNRNANRPNRSGVRGYGNRRGSRFVFGGLPFYFYDGYYHGDCSWLRRKANATGSAYWRQRLRLCRELN